MSAPIQAAASQPIDHWSWLTDSGFLSSLGSAVGGFVAILLFFGIRSVVAYFRSRPKLLRTYFCANCLNRGNVEKEMAGEIQHNRGRLVSDKEELKKLGTKNDLWEYSKDPVHGGHGSCIFYGPYSTDFSEPGSYCATFRIRGVGLSRPEELFEDYILLELDVSKKNTKFVPTEKGIAAFQYDTTMCRRFVRITELAAGGWKEFDLHFQADTHGIWEYRCFAYDGLNERADNCSNLGKSVRILFDSVAIKKIRRFEIPPG